MPPDLRHCRVLVTGGSGFLGQHVLRALARHGASQVVAPRSGEHDLTRWEATEGMLAAHRPDLLIHLAARVGGIGANRAHPGRFLFDNLIMGTQLLELSRRMGVGKFVGVGTVCEYPKHTPVPFREEELWNGYPEETNAPYGLAKKMLLVQSQAYRQEYDFDAIHLLLVNLYGPGDNFDPASSHVIPALIRRLLEAQDSGRDEIVCWGDGTPTREFLYVEDAAEAIVRAALLYDRPEPLNIGSGEEISIAHLTELVAEVIGFKGRIAWDPSLPNGQPRRCLDVSKARAELGWSASTGFREGLERTVAWYRANRPRPAGSPPPAGNAD